MTLLELLAQIQPAELAELVALPLRPVAPPKGQDSDPEWLSAYARFAAGDSTFESTIRALLRGQQVEEALAAEQEATALGLRLSREAEAALGKVWADAARSVQGRLDALQQALQEISPEARSTAAEGLAIAERVRGMQPLPATRDPEALATVRAQLESLEQDTKTAIQLAVEEIRGDRKRLFEAANLAWKRLLDVVDVGPAAEADRSMKLLGALPRLLAERDRDTLARLADSDVPLQEFHAVFVADNQAGGRRRGSKTYSAEFLQSLPEDQYALSPMALSVLDRVDGGEPITTDEALYELQKSAGKLPRKIHQARVWLTRAKNTEDTALYESALGEGLLAEGEHQLEMGNYHVARKLLVDAFVLLARRGRVDEKRAAWAMLAAFAWPMYASAPIANRRRDTLRVADWLGDSRKLLNDLSAPDLRKTVATVWAEELPIRVADRFLQIIDADAGDSTSFIRPCAEHVIDVGLLVKWPDKTVRLLESLLPEGPEHRGLAAQLLEVGEQVGALATESGPGPTRQRLRELAAELRASLGGQTSNARSPLPELVELPALLERIAEPTGPRPPAEDADLSVQLLVQSIFPEERCDDLELPVLVRNPQDSTAAGVEVVLEPEPESVASCKIRVTNGRAVLPPIPPGGVVNTVFTLDLSPRAHTDRNEVRFAFSIRTGDGKARRSPKFSVRLLPSGGRPFKTSPYTAGPAVTGEAFVGRSSELEQLVGAFIGETRNAPVVLGIRRIGKTSLLQEALRNTEVLRRYYPKYWSVEDRGPSDTSVAFLLDLAEQLRSVLPEPYRVRVAFSREEFRHRPYAAFENFVASLDALQMPKGLLILIDEFDKLIHNESAGKERVAASKLQSTPDTVFEPEVFGALRKAIMTSRCLRMGFSGLPSILQLTGHEQRFFGLLTPVEVREFSEKEAERVLQAGAGVLEFSAAAREQLFRASGLQPYLLQVICHGLFGRMKAAGRDMVAPFDVREFVEAQILPNQKYFADYADLAGKDRDILWGLAKAHSRNPAREYVSTREVQRELEVAGLGRELEQIQRVLEGLDQSSAERIAERPLVRRASNDRQRFKLLIGLLGEHLVRKGPGI